MSLLRIKTIKIAMLLTLGAGAYCVASVEYHSPRVNAALVNPLTTIAFRHREVIDEKSISDGIFTVTGEVSGTHVGSVLLADDRKTIIFIPTYPFHSSEKVTVAVDGVKDSNGNLLAGFQYSFFTSRPASFRRTDYELPYTGQPKSKLFKEDQTTRRYQTLSGKITLVEPQMTTLNPDNTFFFLSLSFTGDRGAIYITDPLGELVFYKKVNAPIKNLHKQLNGLLTYFDGKHKAYVGLDSGYRIQKLYRCGNGYSTDFHDIQLSKNGNVLLLSYDKQIINLRGLIPGGLEKHRVVGGIIQELDPSGNVVFQWRTWDYLDPTKVVHPSVLKERNLDYFHANSVGWDSDGNILVSSRNRSEILKLNRQTGDVIWHLGGPKNQFTFIGATRFSLQHDARRLPNGNLTLYDNGNGKLQKFSRALELQLDETKKTATRVWQYRHIPDVFAAGRGGVQRLSNGNSLISWGQIGARPKATFTEISSDGKKMAEMAYVLSGHHSYRVRRLTWAGRPFYPPTLKLSGSRRDRNLYFSWNGATEITAYKIFGGISIETKKFLGERAKTGFENSYPVPNKGNSCQFYRVQPIARGGRATLRSNLVFDGDENCQLSASALPGQALEKRFKPVYSQDISEVTVKIGKNAFKSVHTLVYSDESVDWTKPVSGSADPFIPFAVFALSKGNIQPETFALEEPAVIEVKGDLGNQTNPIVAYWDQIKQKWVSTGIKVVTHTSTSIKFRSKRLTQFALFPKHKGD